MHLTLFQILAVLGNGPSDALTVLGHLNRVSTSDAPSLPAFYRHLRRALEEGWAEILGVGDDDTGPGRPRQVYALTAAGAEAVRDRARELSVYTSLALDGEGAGG